MSYFSPPKSNLSYLASHPSTHKQIRADFFLSLCQFSLLGSLLFMNGENKKETVGGEGGGGGGGEGEGGGAERKWLRRKKIEERNLNRRRINKRTLKW